MKGDVKWNGVVCGVKQAVDEFVKEKELDLFVYDKSNNPTWYVIKK